MHHDQIDSDVDVVHHLLEVQQPQWADLPITAVASSGTDNALYRLGRDMAVRMPLRPSAADPIDKERQWLPLLAPHLPLAVPVPLAKGEPTTEYPWPWSVYQWLEGEDATTAHYDRERAASDLGCFIAALHSVDLAGGPEPSSATFGRGVPLADRDDVTRRAISASIGPIDTDAVTARWEEALQVPRWDRPSSRGSSSTPTLVTYFGPKRGLTTPRGRGAADGRSRRPSLSSATTRTPTHSWRPGRDTSSPPLSTSR